MVMQIAPIITNTKLASHLPKISKKAKTFSGLDMPENIKPSEKIPPNKKANKFFIVIPSKKHTYFSIYRLIM